MLIVFAWGSWFCLISQIWVKPNVYHKHQTPRIGCTLKNQFISNLEQSRHVVSRWPKLLQTTRSVWISKKTQMDWKDVFWDFFFGGGWRRFGGFVWVGLESHIAHGFFWSFQPPPPKKKNPHVGSIPLAICKQNHFKDLFLGGGVWAKGKKPQNGGFSKPHHVLVCFPNGEQHCGCLVATRLGLKRS